MRVRSVAKDLPLGLKAAQELRELAQSVRQDLERTVCSNWPSARRARYTALMPRGPISSTRAVWSECAPGTGAGSEDVPRLPPYFVVRLHQGQNSRRSPDRPGIAASIRGAKLGG